MAIRRPDTPLAATVFNNAQEPQQKPKLTPRQRTDSLIGVRREKAAILTKKRDSISKVKLGDLQKRFNARAESLGMTPKQYSRKLEKDKRKPDVPSSTPDYKQRGGGRNPCPGNVCKK